MVYTMDQSAGDYQQNGYLYNPTSGSQWTSDRPQKQASAKAGHSTFGSGVLVISLLMVLSIDDENCSLPWCV